MCLYYITSCAGSDGSDTDQFTTNKVLHEMKLKGYRFGKQRGEEINMQRGFDAGFQTGKSLGLVCGTFYAALQRDLSSVNHSIMDKIRHIVLSSLPEGVRAMSYDQPLHDLEHVLNSCDLDASQRGVVDAALVELIESIRHLSSV